MSFKYDKMKTNFSEIKNKKIFNSFKNTNNNSETINTTKMNSTSTTTNNNYFDNQNMFQNYSNLNNINMDDSDNINQININNEIRDNQINNPNNIDEVIKNEISSALIDIFLKENQIKYIPMFILYLSEVWKELSKETNSSANINSGINIFTFNKYYHLPGLIGQRLFNLMNKSKNGFLSPDEFISGMCIIFCEEINSLINFIFNFYDFDNDEYITFDDIHAVLCYLPVINCFDDMLDIENEIYSTIGDIFINKKEKIDLNTFSDLIIRKERYELFIPLISFFYDNKPFDNEEIYEFYNEYYNIGKINMNEGKYKIKNVISLKEFETKDNIKNNIIFKYKNSNRIFNSKFHSPNKSRYINEHSDYFLKINKTPKFNYMNTEIVEQICFNENDINDYEKDLDNNKDKEKNNYEKYILKSEAFERMRKSLPLVTGFSKILNSKIKKSEINNKKINQKNINENIKLKYSINDKNKMNNKKKNKGFIYNFCQNLIKNNCMTFNSEIDINSEDSKSICKQISLNIGIDTNSNKNKEDMTWRNDNINLNKRKIIYESYLYKINKKGKLKKLYFKLNNYDLFYYKSKDSKIHKGMHNLSTYFLEIKPIFSNNDKDNISNSNIKYNQKYSRYKITINGIDYFCFLLINIKREIHYYYTPSTQIYEGWIEALKTILKYKNIYQQYIFRQIIGKGKNCLVFYAYDIINKREVAIKKINKTNLTLEDLFLIQTEVDTLKVCQHPYVVKLYEIIETYNEINIILEYCELGNLYFYLSKVKFNLSEEQIVTYIHNISKAVYSMHNLGIIHRDLKLSNIAVTNKNNKVEIRILDFGLSKILGPNQSCNEGYGTPGYAAPEVISRFNYSFEADIWSIGVIAYFLCVKKLPFDYIREGNQNMDMIENTLLDDVKFDHNIMKKYSKYAEKFIKDLMNKNTFERPNIREVLEHQWFQLFFRNEVKKRIINTYKTEFYQNPEIEDLNTYDENYENSKDDKANYLLYTNVNNK